ncbi:MAG: restriction endonuclease subunit S [Deltaproteobacteria bacterium]|nr:restriction endonuclease subunit S [Deltaproteobacteria bacterium]
MRVEPAKMYQFAGVYSFGRGVFRGQRRIGSEFAYGSLTALHLGDFVYPKLMAWEGAFGVVQAECDGCVVSPEFPVFEPHVDRLDPKFLRFYFQRPKVWESISGKSIGTNVRRRRLHPTELLQHELPLPPLPEQRQIVARIEELAAKIEEARGLRRENAQEADILVNSKLRAFFRDAESNRIEFKSIGSFTTYDRYGPRFYNEAYSEEGIPILRATDIDDSGRVDYRFLPKMSVSSEEKDKLSLHVGDLVVVRSGSVGLSAVFNRTNFACIPAAYLIQFRFEKSIDPYYVRYCLQCPLVQDELRGRGTALKNINANKIKSVRIPFFPISEQRRIVSYLDSLQAKVDTLKRLQAETATELDALLPSVLDKAFKGEL